MQVLLKNYPKNIRLNYREYFVIRAINTTSLFFKNTPFKIIQILGNPFLTSIILFGLIFDIGFINFYLSRNEFIAKEFLWGYLFALLWLNIGPWLIWKYKNDFNTSFLLGLRKIINKESVSKQIFFKYHKIFSKYFWYIVIILLPFICYIYLVSTPALTAAGINGPSDFHYWSFLVAICWTVILGSSGFMGVIITILLGYEISKHNLFIDPLALDKFGGLKFVNSFTLTTTTFFATGSLFFPVAFQVMSYEIQITPYVTFFLILATFFILISYILPTLFLHFKIKTRKKEILSNIKEKYEILKKEIENNNNNTQGQLFRYIKLDLLRKEFLDYKCLDILLFNFRTITQLFFSATLPLIIEYTQYILIKS